MDEMVYAAKESGIPQLQKSAELKERRLTGQLTLIIMPAPEN